jgi:hypothetical protein
MKNMRWLDEVALHVSVMAGDQEAFAELMRRYDPIVRRQLGRVTPDEALDEEVAEFWCALIEVELRPLAGWHAGLGGPLAQWLQMLAAQAAAARLRALAA